MAARAGMDNLVKRLRGMTAAGSDDYTVTNVTYWTDDQLEDALDDHRTESPYEMLISMPDMIGGGSVEYHAYGFRHENVEEAASGTTAWVVRDSTGSAISTAAYTPNYRAGQIRFTANTHGTAYYLTYRSFDIERAAADVWEQKAGHVYDRYDLKTDNHDLKRSQIHQHCMDQAALHRRRAPAAVRQMRRSDVNAAHATTHHTPPGWTNISGGTADT